MDASVTEGANFFSVGMVVRDHQGLFVQGKTMKFAGQVSVMEAEMVGILEALLWINVLPDKPITVWSQIHCVQAINKMKHNQLEVGHLIDQCCSILRNKSSVSVVFIRKQANKVAHLLAKLPCTINSFVEFSSPPL